MAVESAADRLAMLADFGQSITYTAQGGSPSTITGIFDNDYAEVDAGGMVGFAMACSLGMELKVDKYILQLVLM